MGMNEILRDKESAFQERAFLKKEGKLSFAEQIDLAKKNIKNSLEITAYVNKAREILAQGFSIAELTEMGETDPEKLEQICGPDNDPSVIVAICEYLENQIISKTRH